MFNINLTTNKTTIRNILFCFALTTFVLKPASQEQIQKFALKKIDIGQEAHLASGDNFIIRYDDAIDLFDNIKSTDPRYIFINPLNFFRIIRQIGIMDAQKHPHLDGKNLLFVNLNRMNFKSINSVVNYLEIHNIQPKNVAILDIAFNDITSVTKKEMKKFPNVISINLSQNRINKVDSNAFDECKLLRLINLQFNRIESGLSKMIEKFHKSSDIRLSAVNNNPINDAEANSITNFYLRIAGKAYDRSNNMICCFHTLDEQQLNPLLTDLLCTAIGFDQEQAVQKFMKFSGDYPNQNLHVIFEQEKYEYYNPCLDFKFRNWIKVALKIVEEIKQDKLLEETLNDLWTKV